MPARHALLVRSAPSRGTAPVRRRFGGVRGTDGVLRPYSAHRSALPGYSPHSLGSSPSGGTVSALVGAIFGRSSRLTRKSRQLPRSVTPNWPVPKRFETLIACDVATAPALRRRLPSHARRRNRPVNGCRLTEELETLVCRLFRDTGIAHRPDRRHDIASAQAICPSKPRDVAMAR